MATIDLSTDYLESLGELLKKHKYRAVFGTCIIETLTGYRSKQLTKKCPFHRQVELVRLVKNLFYVRFSEIMSFMNKVQSYLGGKCGF